MICYKCHGDGFLEYDNSYMSYGIMHERWVVEKCENCDGTGKVDQVASTYARSGETEESSQGRS